ncbi:MAG: GMC family oxidoreductase [Polyangiaceae bacterium]|nr:GMC family oxidoreductase [Polyangiaceae bacterium]MCE7890330.1 FAD-dependent oxidoreductase [Sorangiineae bacterium PRO1]MCL4755274.1 GMC family oxidoreductase [Myxococcales bacterium]
MVEDARTLERAARLLSYPAAHQHVSPTDEPQFSDAERRIALALAQAVLPFSGRIPGGDLESVARLERFASRQGETFFRGVRASLWAVEASTLGRRGRPFSRLSGEERMAALEAWSQAGPRGLRWLLRAVVTPLKAAHFDDPRVFAEVGCRYSVEPPKPERERFMEQVTNGREIDEDLELECDVVVVGTGAGGAAAAYELARRGRAVLMLEDGDYHRRDSFAARAQPAFQKMYLGRGTTIALGNVAAPVWAGRAVGGSTVINSGTCYRTPAHTFRLWAEQHGLGEISAATLGPYYERVEQMLGVAEAPAEHLGGPARVIARGAQLMGLAHGPLRRNAPDCDGQGVCCFGCPTGAKRSTDVSYVPEALKRGAQLVTGARVERVDVTRGRARGVSGRLASGRRLSVRAQAVVVAAGAFSTPLLLRRSGVCVRSPWLGKNLSIHPAAKVMAEFTETIDMSRGIPQSYSIDQWAEEGLMFEGGSTPIDITALGVPWVGRRFMHLMDRFMNLATFGFMIQDESRGEVRQGPRGSPLIFYNLSRKDTARMQRGIEILSEVFLRAGARRVLPLVHGCDELASEAGLARLKKMRLRPGDFEVTAFHPLGTCRMGTSPERGAIDPSHESFDTPGVYVTDGSAIPSSLGVNPQLTIMALALRAAEIIDGRLG